MNRLIVLATHMQALQAVHGAIGEDVTRYASQLQWRHDDGGFTQFAAVEHRDFLDRLRGLPYDIVEWRCEVTQELRAEVLALTRAKEAA